MTAVPDSLENSRVCLFTLGDHRFITEGHFVKQIISIDQITPVPRANSALWGLTTVEGTILPLVNSYQIFNMNSSQAQLAIVLEDAEHQLAFAIDRVEGFQFFDTSFESVSLKSKPAFHSFLSSSFCKDDQIYYLLNTQDLLRLSEQSFVLT